MDGGYAEFSAAWDTPGLADGPLSAFLSTGSWMVAGVVCMLAVDGHLRREGQVLRPLRKAGLAVAAGVLLHALLLVSGLLEWGYVSLQQVVMHLLLPLALALGPWQPRPRSDDAESPVPTGLVAGGLGVVATTLDLARVMDEGFYLEWLASQGPPGLASLGLSLWLLRQCRPWVTPTERKVSLVALGTWAVMLAALLLYQQS